VAGAGRRISRTTFLREERERAENRGPATHVSCEYHGRQPRVGAETGQFRCAACDALGAYDDREVAQALHEGRIR
jgi:hypothetical protein